jgi:hypothetical protein
MTHLYKWHVVKLPPAEPAPTAGRTRWTSAHIPRSPRRGIERSVGVAAYDNPRPPTYNRRRLAGPLP